MLKFAALAVLASTFHLTPSSPEQSTGAPSGSPAQTLHGSVAYHQRVSLPPDAVLQVTIEDVSQTDASAKPFAEQDIPTKSRKLPLKFAVKYDAGAIDPAHHYNLRAKITTGGRLMFTSTNSYPVLTQGAPTDNVSIDLEQVSAQYGQHLSDSTSHAAAALIGTRWTLAEVDGKAPDNESPQAYIELADKTQRVEGSGGCNRLMGTYQLDGRTLHFKEVASTMMACNGDVMTTERALLAALGATESYRIHSTTLTLLARDGKVLARLEAQQAATEAQ